MGDEQQATDALVRALYAQHSRMVLRQITSLLGGDRAAAEDVLQEALVRAWRNKAVLDFDRRHVRAWLVTTARHLVVDRYRARLARPPEVPQDSPAVSPLAEDHSGQVVDAVTVGDALRTLSPAHRGVLEETYLHDRSVEQTARLLNIPVGTVKSRLHHARLELRRQLVDAQVSVAASA